MSIKTGFKSVPKLDNSSQKHWKNIVKLLKNNEVEYTQDHEITVIQLAKALSLQDIYEQSINEHGVLIDNGKGQLKTNPATVSLASCKANINALIVQLMLSPKSQGKALKPTEDDSDFDFHEGIEIY